MKKNEEEKKKRPDRKFNTVMTNLSGMINDLQSSIYGTSDGDEIDKAGEQFRDILELELKSLRGSGINGNDDMTSFISKLYNQEKNKNRINDIFNKEMNLMSIGSDNTSIGAFLTDIYRNKLVQQADLNDITNQLIELREAVNVMRDAILTADIVDGRINREIKFRGIDETVTESYMNVIQSIEDKFELQSKIKSYITKHCLTYGEYFVYVIPYSEIFSEFMRNKDKYKTASLYVQESTLIDDPETITLYKETGDTFITLGLEEDANEFIESCADKFEFDEMDVKQFKVSRRLTDDDKVNKLMTEDFKYDMKDILNRINVVNSEIPLPVLEEGLDSLSYFNEAFMDESGSHFTEKKEPKMYSDNTFVKFMKNSDVKTRSSESSEGIFSDEGGKKEDFSDIKDCYVKMLPPTRVIEIKIMDEVIGYFYIKTDDTTPLSGILSSTLYQAKYNQKRNNREIIDEIAGRIITKFNKKFLKDNPKFKKIIVEALNYYDLNEQSISFQYIPKEYMVAFKIDKDEDGNGTSMLDGSLFYAKLYLMLLLFKILSIILNSNDTKVNYIKQSGIDKDLVNKVQQIAIQKQSRNINIMDLFNYTSLINKIGSGNELFIPVGRSGDRPMETDILSGQDVQINNELMELLRNSYILGTGVPAAIINYLNEADFAKSIEVANTKFNGRVVNYQLDLNPGITELYQKILLYSSNIPEEDIKNLSVTLIPPKSGQNNVKQEQIQNFQTIADFLVNLYYGESQNEEGEEFKVMQFKLSLAKMWLPMLNFEEIENAKKESEIKGEEENLRPKTEPTDEEILGQM